MNVKKMKMQLMATAASVLISGIALTSATYAWYVANNTVEATTTKISATTNGFILQIATAEQGPQHGGEQTSLAASTTGGVISPSSTNDLINWYVCEGWNGEGKVTSYRKPTFVADGKSGQYGTDGKLKPVAVTYPYIYATTYADQNNQNWVATKVGKNYEVSSGTQKIASSVGYGGVKMRVYIWMEGTDADCVNNAAAEDPATYNVNVKLAGISAE